MGFYIAPGVYTKELDISQVIPSLSTTIAALVGPSPKGKVGVKLITNTRDFIQEYGKPVVGNMFHYSALAFLAQGNQLYCRRVTKATGNTALYGGIAVNKTGTGTTAVALTAGVTTPTVPGSGYTDATIFIFGKDPGAWNDNISIKVVPNSGDSSWFDIQVYYTESGVTELKETWTVSKTAQLDGYGNQMYLETRINGFSNYIVVADKTSVVEVPATMANALATDGGADGDAAGDSDFVLGWDDFVNPNDIDVRILINGGQTGVTVQTKMKAIAEDRKDCIAVLDIPYASCGSTADMVTFRSSTQNFNSSYCALYGSWVNIWDEYNDKSVYVCPSGFVAGAYAYNDFKANVWNAPAGFNRGLLNVLGVQKNFTMGEIATLQAAQINPIVNFRGNGVAIWGIATEQTKASALSDVPVRRLLIVLEKAISISLLSNVFDPNSALTRDRITSTIESYLGDLSAQGAFQLESGDRGFQVLCNDINNTPATIDKGELHVDCFVKPARTAKFIQLQVIITPSGANFQELITKGGLL